MMHSKSDSIIVIIGNDTDEVIQGFFSSLLHKYHIGLEQFTKGSNSIFEYVWGMHYLCSKIRIKRGGSCIHSHKWIKSQKATINPNNNDEKCFQYAIRVALNHE